MTLPTYGQPIVRADIEAGATTLAELDDVVIAAPAAGDILIYDGVDSWRNRVMTGDIAITAAGLTAIQAGVIVDADISPTAEIQVSKLADGAARQILQTAADGVTVEWTDNVDIPGTLDVSGLGTFDAGAIIVVGDLDLNSQGSILNVGAAGNDWTAALLTHTSASSPGVNFITTTASTNAQIGVLTIELESAGDATDGFGPVIIFQQDDTGAAAVQGLVGFVRAGADGTTDFRVTTRVAGANNAAFEVTSAGVGRFDAAGAGDALPTLFDDEDDAIVVRSLQLTAPRIPWVTDVERAGHFALMLRLGIFVEKMGDHGPGTLYTGGGSPYMMQIQPTLRLLAGGIYQNRWALDHLREEHVTRFSTVEDRLGAVETAEGILRWENADLKKEVARLRKLVEV